MTRKARTESVFHVAYGNIPPSYINKSFCHKPAKKKSSEWKKNQILRKMPAKFILENVMDILLSYNLAMSKKSPIHLGCPPLTTIATWMHAPSQDSLHNQARQKLTTAKCVCECLYFSKICSIRFTSQ